MENSCAGGSLFVLMITVVVLGLWLRGDQANLLLTTGSYQGVYEAAGVLGNSTGTVAEGVSVKQAHLNQLYAAIAAGSVVSVVCLVGAVQLICTHGVGQICRGSGDVEQQTVSRQEFHRAVRASKRNVLL